MKPAKDANNTSAPADALAAHVGRLDAVNAARGLTPREVTKRYRCSAEKVRGWIERGELGALNLADVKAGRPRFVVLPEHLAAFEQTRAAATPKPAPVKKPRRQPGAIDFFPGA